MMSEITINLVGDFILARRMHNVYEHESASNILNETFDIFKSGDLNICNLETVISNKGMPYPKGEKNPYYFRCSANLAGLLVDSNVHAVTTGNNHSMDYGAEGLDYQQNCLEKMGVVHAGSGKNLAEAKKIAYIQVKDVVVALISFSTVKPKTLCATENKAGIFYISSLASIAKELKELIQRAKESANIVIVSPHWTENWETEPEEEHRRQARMMIDLGCDAVMGHSSHLLMGVEIYKNKPIAYDMGTFLVDTIKGHNDLRYSALFQLIIKDTQLQGMRIYPTVLSDGHVCLAQGSDRQKIFDKINSLNSHHMVYEELNNSLIIKFEASKCQNKQRIVSFSKRDKEVDNVVEKPDIVVDKLPTWCDNFLPVKMEKGYEFLGFLSVEVFRTGSGFLLFLAFKVGQKDNINYEIDIFAESNYGSSFSYLHPLSNGVYNSVYWEQGECLVDVINVRVNSRVQPGKYKLYFGIKNISTGEFIKSLKGENHIPFTDIYVLPELISNLASGIDWSGRLPSNVKHKFEAEFMKTPEQWLFKGIRQNLVGENGLDKNFSLRAIELKYKFDRKISLVYLTVFQENIGRMRWGSRRDQLKKALLRNIEKLSLKQEFDKYDVTNSSGLGILMEMVVEKKDLDISQLILDKNLYEESRLGFEFVVEGKIDDLYTEAECRYYHLYTNRQKIAFALIRRGVDDFESLEQYLTENLNTIIFRHVQTVAILDYEDQVGIYNGTAKVDDLLVL